MEKIIIWSTWFDKNSDKSLINIIVTIYWTYLYQLLGINLNHLHTYKHRDLIYKKIDLALVK